MEQLLAGESPIDNEIAIIRTQIEALRHRRSLLSHALLSSRKLKSRFSSTTDLSGVQRASIEATKQQIQEHENNTVANLYRACSGITAFRVQDPDPNAVDNGNVLGIRFEVLSTKQRAFQAPYYVLLNQPNGDGQLRVHKHTIPVFIPMHRLVKKYLPFIADAEDASPLKSAVAAQDLSKFVRALRKELIAHHKRVEACEQLKKDLGRRQGVDEVRMLDVSGREIEIIFVEHMVARIRVATDGAIERAVTGPSKTAPDDGAGSMQVYREIKKVIEGGSGRIDDLAERLKRRS